jgi:hypothetical protein
VILALLVEVDDHLLISTVPCPPLADPFLFVGEED